ncbi:hypothetical protein ECC02_007021 [Trypanosoma cruzi]|uniref:Transmembrane protein n=1 Tax=Trypanosoma cruzi TaxID=5693 RepID=A0A7J6Y001_TRYCR|nr:hypothetical protein ECC02_007021 [Trypanosoma cruzi]
MMSESCSKNEGEYSHCSAVSVSGNGDSLYGGKRRRRSFNGPSRPILKIFGRDERETIGPVDPRNANSSAFPRSSNGGIYPPFREQRYTLRHDTFSLSSDVFSSRDSSSGSFMQGKNIHSRSKDFPVLQPKQKEQPQGQLAFYTEKTAQIKEGFSSLSMSQILPLDESPSPVNEKANGSAKDNVMESGTNATNVGASIPEFAPQSKATAGNIQQKSWSIDGSAARQFIGFSHSTLSELTCVQLSPFEMPVFPNIDSLGTSVAADENFKKEVKEKEKECQQQKNGRPICVAPKEESPLAWSFNTTSREMPIMHQLPPLFDDCDSERERCKFMCHPFLLFILLGLLLPFALQELFVVVNHFATSGPIICGGVKCVCSLEDVLLYIFAYGIHMYIPFALFSPTLFFLSYDVVLQKAREKELRARMECYAVPEHTSSHPCPHTADRIAASSRQGGGDREFPRETNDFSLLHWDLPSCFSIMRRGAVFWIIVVARFVLLAIMDTQLPLMSKVPVAVWGPMRLVALSLPLIIYSLYETRPFFAVPYVLLDAFPLLFQVILGDNNMPVNTRCMAGPMLLVVLERCLWYVSVTAIPEEVPVGVKITVSATFTAMYFVLILALSLLVDIKNGFYVAIVMALQVFFLELLFNILLLELLAFRLYTFVMKSVFRRTVELPQMKCTDSTNISTQVRWPTLIIAIGAISPFFQFHQWPRAIPHSDCHGILSKKIIVHIGMFFIVIGVIILATVITLIARWKHEVLRMPLILEDWFLLFIWGWYVFSSVPLALAAVF